MPVCIYVKIGEIDQLPKRGKRANLQEGVLVDIFRLEVVVEGLEALLELVQLLLETEQLLLLAPELPRLVLNAHLINHI
jgi:hypothetical protein